MKPEYIPWPAENPGPWAGVWLESVGRRDCRGSHFFTSPNFFCTHLVARGRLRVQTGQGVDCVVGPGDLFSLWPGISHRFGPEPPTRGEDVDMDWIRLHGPLARPFMRALGTCEERPCAPAADPECARDLMRTLQELARHYTREADMRSVAILHELASACGYRSKPSVGRRSLAEKVRDAMVSQLELGMNVEGFARAFGVSRSLLFLEFRKRFGTSPVKVLNQLRIDRARALLTETELPIKDVAVMCGDANPLYFSRRFRHATGLSPTAYRQAHGTTTPEA